MNFTTSLKTFSVAGAVLALASCMTGTPNDDAPASRAQAVEFINATSAPLAKTAAPDNQAIAAQLEAIGCPKLAQLFKDFHGYTGQGAFPKSFVDYLSCFGLSAAPTPEEIDDMTKKFQNPEELLNCICGGSGLANMFQGVKWTEFKATASGAAGSSFKATTDIGGGFKATTHAIP